MTLETFVMFLLIGAAAGFIASRTMRGLGMGLVGNIVVGIAGAFIGGFVFGLFGVSFGGVLGVLFTATLGAVLLLAMASALTRRRLYT